MAVLSGILEASKVFSIPLLTCFVCLCLLLCCVFDVNDAVREEQDLQALDAGL